MAEMASKKSAAAGIRSGRGFLLMLVAMAGLALLLRLGVWAELGAVNGGRNSVYTPSVFTDLATYMKLGREIAAGEYSGPFYYQPFYYAVFLPVCYWLSAGSIGFVIFVQSLLGAGTSWFAGLAAARLFGRTAGIVAAGFVAISTPLLLYAPFHQNETLQAFNLTLLFYLSLRACERWNLRRWCAVGVVAGIAILTRGNIVLFLPGLMIALAWAGRRRGIRWPRLAAGCALLLATAYLVQLPFIIHNTRETGELTGPSTAADAVLALGNSPEAPAGGRNPGLPAGPMEYPEAYSRMMVRAEEGMSVPEQMFEMMCREPGAFFELQFRKLLLFWDSREIPNNVSLYGEGESSRILRWLLPGRSLVLLPLGLSGLLFAIGRAYRRREVKLWLLLYFVAVYWGATALFYILSRFRAPILPLIAVAAGGFAAWFLRRWRLAPEKRRQLLLYGGGTLVAMFWISSSSYDFYRTHLEASLARCFRPDGVVVSFGGPPYRLDHGPMTFGGWEMIEITPGRKLAKRFAGVTAPGEVEWTVLTGRPGRIRYRVNGVPRTYLAEKPGFSKLRFPVTSREGEFTIEIVGFTGEHWLFYDTQRNYGRSQLDGKPLDGEWIMRFYEGAGERFPGSETKKM